ncbi:MAG: DUF1461 domain-containing protein [Clostridia bacterium]|nr:DUF1461 domain-containing protein [Clostridia bacterium]
MRRALCFCAGLVLAIVLAITAIAGPATRTGLFVRALIQTVDKARTGVTDEQLAAFGEETMAYLRGEKPDWQPQIPAEGVAPSFRAHMAEVRGWVSALKWVIGAGILLCIFLCLLRGFDRPAFIAGACTVVGLIAAVILWALVDFHSLWMILHRVFIPGGIFPAGEPVMQLFPLSLFFQYITPVAGMLLVETLLFMIIMLKCKRT